MEKKTTYKSRKKHSNVFSLTTTTTMIRVKNICQIWNFILQNYSKYFKHHVISIAKWYQVQTTFYTANISQSTGMGTRQKNPKGKNYEKVYIRTIEKKYFLASYKISLRLTHYTLFLAWIQHKGEKMEKVESCQKYHNFGPNIESLSSTVFYHNLLATLVTACKRSNSCFLIFRHNQLKMLLTCIIER